MKSEKGFVASGEVMPADIMISQEVDSYQGLDTNKQSHIVTFALGMTYHWSRACMFAYSQLRMINAHV